MRRRIVGGMDRSVFAGIEYGWADAGLWRWVESANDGPLSAIVERFLGLSDDERSCFVAQVKAREFDWIRIFAQRQTLRALRFRDPEVAERALIALAMIDADRYDFRDLLRAIELAQAVHRELGGRTDAALQHASGLAPVASRRYFDALVNAPEDRVALAHSGVEIVSFDDAPVMIDRSFHRDRSTSDLGLLAVELGHLVESLGYVTRSVASHEQVPGVWFEGGDGAVTAASNLGAASVMADLRRQPMRIFEQSLMCFVMECATPGNAQDLAARAIAASGGDRLALPVLVGPVLVVSIFSSGVVGVSLIESADSVERFRHPITDLLTRHLHTPG